ncbi:MAG: ribose-phosphate diphosphokinase [Planctomycetota bacterium]
MSTRARAATRRGSRPAVVDTRAAPLLFALEGSRALGERVGACLGRPLAPHEEREFEYGQHKTRALVSVRRRRVYVLHSLHGEPGQSANDKLVRLLFFTGALRDAGAAEVTAVVPFLCYARKERRTQLRDPVSTRYLAALFEAVGTERVVVLDVHSLAAFENAFRCRVEHLEAQGAFAAHFARALADEEVTVVSPDAGGAKRATRFRGALEDALGRRVGAAWIDKTRSGGEVRGEAVAIGELRGRAAVLYDDMICGGTTVARAARACLEAGATRVQAAATHGAFTLAANAALADAALERVVVLDTLPPFALDPGLVARRLTLLPGAPLLAEGIRRVEGTSAEE